MKCKMHNVRFYQPKPRAIKYMTLNQLERKLAIARIDASIEIWNITNAPFIEKIIPTIISNESIEGLKWYKNRLFSVGLHSFLVEYDLFKLTIKNTRAVTGGAAYCLDINEDNNQIAIGTELGYLNIFAIDDEEVLFERFLDKQEGKILCLQYDCKGEFLVGGSIDFIRIWEVKTGHAIHKMSTGRSENHKETTVWCLAVTRDFIIISGDSRGRLTFWDGNNGSQIESYQSHKADILTLFLSDDVLYCAGVDPNIVSYAKVHVKGANYKWVKSINRKVHDHDVCALVLCENKLYSGGTDAYLACSYHPPRTLLKYPPVTHNSGIVIALEARLIMLQYMKHIEVWALSERDAKLNNKECKPLKMLVLQKRLKKDGVETRESILSSSISSNGRWIIYSTDSTISLLTFSFDVFNATCAIKAVPNLPKECGIFVKACFTADSKQLILARREGGLQILKLSGEKVKLHQNINTIDYFQDTITHLFTSNCGKYLIAADPQSNISIWKYEKKWEHYCKMPKYEEPLTAIAIQPETYNIVVSYSDHRIMEYRLERKKFSKFSRHLIKKNISLWVNRNFPVRNIIFDPQSPHIVIFHDDSSIVIMDKTKELPEPEAKIPRIDLNTSRKLLNIDHTFHAIKKYKHLLYLDRLSDDEMVSVEITPASLMELLPPCFKQNIFGSK